LRNVSEDVYSFVLKVRLSARIYKEIERKQEVKIRKYDFTEEENGTDDDDENFVETADCQKRENILQRKVKQSCRSCILYKYYNVIILSYYILFINSTCTEH